MFARVWPPERITSRWPPPPCWTRKLACGSGANWPPLTHKGAFAMLHLSGFEIRVSMAVVIAAVFSTAAYGQAVKGSIVGAVTDSSGGAVPNAQVVMTETRTGLVRKVQANQNGFYSVPDILPGTYSLSFEYAGFRRLVRDNVEVLLN